MEAPKDAEFIPYSCQSVWSPRLLKQYASIWVEFLDAVQICPESFLKLMNYISTLQFLNLSAFPS